MVDPTAPERRCERCSAPIAAQRMGRPRKFCSVSCRWQVGSAPKAAPKPRPAWRDAHCKRCERAFRKASRQQEFCSLACANKGKRPSYRLALRPCAQCGRPFRPKEAKYSTCCSRECGWLYQASQRREDNEAQWIGTTCPVPWHNCSECGRQFYSRRDRASCSRECDLAIRRRLARREHPTLTTACSECGQPFTYVRYNHERLTCSDRCDNRRSRRLDPDGHAARKARRDAILRRQFALGTADLVIPKRVFDRDGWRCWLCGQLVDRHARVPHYGAPTMDHVIPLAMGGEHTYENIRCAHFICNSRRGTKPVPGGSKKLAACTP